MFARYFGRSNREAGHRKSKKKLLQVSDAV